VGVTIDVEAWVVFAVVDVIGVVINGVVVLLIVVLVVGTAVVVEVGVGVGVGVGVVVTFELVLVTVFVLWVSVMVPIVVMVVGFVLAIFDSVVAITFPKIDPESTTLFDDSVLFVLCTAPKYKESIYYF